MKSNSIGIFDSGIGGLSILKEIQSLLPHESIIYFADSKNCPYGGKTKHELHTLAKSALSYLSEQKVKLMVIACNTVTVTCIDRLRKDFLKTPIIGIVPVVKTASEKSRAQNIGILSTSTTSKSEQQAELIATYAPLCQVTAVGTDELVPLIESGEVESQKFDTILKKVLEPFVIARIDTLALGCSHFPLIRDKIQQVLGDNILILDSGEAVARHVKKVLIHENMQNDKKARYEFITTGKVRGFTKAIQNVISLPNDTIRSI